jgi:DNA polymerase (family 10)
MLSINPDAHSIGELDLMKWGVAVARKGGVPKDRVLNAMSLAQMLDHLGKRRLVLNTSAPRKTSRKHIPDQAAG